MGRGGLDGELETSDSQRRRMGRMREQLAHPGAAVAAGAGQAEDLEGIELNGSISSIAHLAYHFGAIRQIDRSLRGPSAEQAAS